MTTALESRIARIKRGEILAPHVERFLSNWNGQFSKETLEVILELAARPPRDRVGSFSASNLGKCMRQQALAYQGQPEEVVANPIQTSLFHDGSWRHLRWQGIFLEMGLVARDAWSGYLLEVPVEIPELEVRGTLDVILNLEGERWIVDIKGANPFSFSKAERGEVNQGYRWQLQTYMRAIQIPRAMLWYEDKSTQELHEIVITSSDKEAQEVWARMRGLKRFRDLRRLPPQLPGFPTELECRKCPFLLGCEEASSSL